MRGSKFALKYLQKSCYYELSTPGAEMAALRVCSLFSGIGGFEVGFGQAGLETVFVCDNDPAANAILKRRLNNIRYGKDISEMKSLPRCDVLTAGWPCQDLSQAGRMAGSEGSRSSLVKHVFRLLRAARSKPRFVVLENVAFALHLQKGRAIHQVTKSLEALGYQWAYRILDTREFGLPHRRRRIFIVGARSENPSSILFDGLPTAIADEDPNLIGFYWTEGNRGIGWSPEAVPPLKGGSGFSIPSPPAIWDRTERTFFVPGIKDAERLQGFSSGWTSPAYAIAETDRVRWRLIGNAVSVPVARWIGQRLVAFEGGDLRKIELPDSKNLRRHNMACGGPELERRETYVAIEGPAKPKRKVLSDFKFQDRSPLSARAASGFFERLKDSPLNVDRTFMQDLGRFSKYGHCR